MAICLRLVISWTASSPTSSARAFRAASMSASISTSLHLLSGGGPKDAKDLNKADEKKDSKKEEGEDKEGTMEIKGQKDSKVRHIGAKRKHCIDDFSFQHMVDKDPTAYLNPDQPLISLTKVSQDDVDKQEARVIATRKRLADAVKALEQR